MDAMNTTDPITPTPRLGRYRIDPDATTINFRTRHVFGLLPVRGTFEARGGTVDVAEPTAASSVHVEIDAASFHTGTAQRDREVRSARYLDVERHPVITFEADGFDDPGGTHLDGTLTVCGVAQPARLTVHDVDADGSTFTARAATRVDRTQHGITAGRGITGRYLDIDLEVTCVRP